MNDWKPLKHRSNWALKHIGLDISDTLRIEIHQTDSEPDVRYSFLLFQCINKTKFCVWKEQNVPENPNTPIETLALQHVLDYMGACIERHKTAHQQTENQQEVPRAHTHRAALTMQGKQKQILFRDWYDVAYVEDGIIRVERLDPRTYYRPDIPMNRYFEPIRQMAAHYGFDIPRYDLAYGVLLACNGKPVSELIKEFQRRRDRNTYARKVRKEDAAVWKKLQEQFSNFVLGVDDIDIYPTGMTISILLNSLKTFDQQREFVKENKKALIRHIQKEMPRTKQVSKKLRQTALDTLPYCDLTEITLTRRNLLVLRYDIKQQIQNALEEKEQNNDI